VYKLIVIDDEEKIADGIAKLFPWESIGFEVTGVFTCAKDALAFIDKNPTDVVMTDIEMPDMSGVQLSEELAARDAVITVFFSSYDRFEYMRAAIRNGVADYLLKPIKYAALLDCFEKIRQKLDDARHYTQAAHPAEYYDSIVSRVTEYLKNTYRSASLEDAAEMVNLSPTYLSHIYKSKNGAGFSETLHGIRMEKACEMLADNSYKMYDIAYYLGYDNPKNFSRAFKSSMGMSPSKYREAAMNANEKKP
jgi:two-component system, response regulator YesN